MHLATFKLILLAGLHHFIVWSILTQTMNMHNDHDQKSMRKWSSETSACDQVGVTGQGVPDLLILVPW